ncbi:hypothetical protein [Paraliomyxa miuraensis]|uniref:hypothetical protein n=1 Tax=Paraliomyxa miuraensis TaxID=376150 RepID=UPI002258B8AB|nr:hypothetical protein [Paraliomyxa miuraensis]MCX4243550.1 hypothetical protein [Paraliomyxa miuraensis]
MSTTPGLRWPDEDAELLARLATAPEARLHAWMCDAAEHAIDSCRAVARAAGHGLPDPTPIEIKRRWLEGQATTEELRRAQADAVAECCHGSSRSLGAAVLGCAWHPGGGLELPEDERHAQRMTQHGSAFEATCSVLRQCIEAAGALSHRAAWSSVGPHVAAASARRAREQEQAWQVSHVLGDRPRVSAELGLDGVISLGGDPTGDEDHAWLHPGRGFAVVARGRGAIGNQGRPGSKLAVWSLAGELSWSDEPTLEGRLRRGWSRAECAVQRLTANWPVGLLQPSVRAAAVLLEGSTALVMHVGDCSVARLESQRLLPLTRPHTVGADHPEAPIAIAGSILRALGRGEPSFLRIPVRVGDVLLLSTVPWPDGASLRGRSVDEISASLARAGSSTVIAARVRAMASGPLVRGSVRPPAAAWLYRPGQPLDEPPERYAVGTHGRGPDARWFADVFDAVVNDER